MAKSRGKGSDIIRQISVDRLQKVQTWTMPRKAIEKLTKKQAADFERGFEERTRDFNQGKANSTIEVPSETEHFWKGYQFAQAQEGK